MLPELPRGSSYPGSSGGTRQPWYAVRVKSNRERVVTTALAQKGYEEFTPFYRTRRRWSDRVKIVETPLFPGYVFCRLDPNRRLPVLETPGVVHIVSFGNKFAPLDEGEIEAVRAITTSGAEVRPWPYLRVGQRVHVRSGALRGVEGFLLDLKDGRRLLVSISLMQRSVTAELDRADIELIL